MQYANFNNTFYIRLDRGDEIIGSLLNVCEREGIPSAIFSGIGGCSSAAIQTFIPAEGAFHTETKSRMLELVSLMGNIVSGNDGKRHHHTHALFSYVEDGKHGVLSGHLKESTVLYTAEIELRPVIGGAIGRQYDPETGTGFWKLPDQA